jgi:hypothetical protein
MDKIDDSDPGTWQITTETSIYVLDLDRGRVIRHPGAAADAHRADDGAFVFVAHLPNDAHWVPLILLFQCEIGAPLVLLTGETDDHPYWRVSTLVTAIRRLDEPADHQPTSDTGHGPTDDGEEPFDARRDG